MRNRFLNTTIRVGLVTGAATAGSLVGFGLRPGTSLQAFLRLGAAMLGPVSVGRLQGSVVVFVGVLVHVAWMMIWSGAFLIVAARRGLAASVAAAVIITSVAMWLSSVLVTSALGAIRYAALDQAQLVAIVVVMTLSLAVAHPTTTGA